MNATVRAQFVAVMFLLIAGPEVAGAATLEGYFRHSADGLYIGRTESVQTAATGPLSDEQPAGGPSSVDLYSRYTVDYGSISVVSVNSGARALSTEGPLPGSLAGASASFSDRFTINSASAPFYSAGTMQIRVDVTGQLSASGYASSSFNLNLFVGSSFGTQIYATQYGDSPEWGPILSGKYFGDEFGSYLFTVPFTFGAANNLSMKGFADAGDGDPGPGGSASADFAHTFAWAGIVGVFDETGAPVTDFQMISESGYDYATLKPAIVPLPATVWLLGTALMGLASLKRLRGRSKGR